MTLTPSQIKILPIEQQQKHFLKLKDELPDFLFEYMVKKSKRSILNPFIIYKFIDNIDDDKFIKIINFFSNKKFYHNIFQDIHNNINSILNALNPFLSCFPQSDKIELSVCGGALRDIFLNNIDNIKDIDICLHYPEVLTSINVPEILKKINTKFKDFNIPELNYLNIYSDFSKNDFFYHEESFHDGKSQEEYPVYDSNNLLKFAFSKVCSHILTYSNYETTSFFSPEFIKNEKEKRKSNNIPYKISHLHSVIKVNSPNFKHPVDLLFIHIPTNEYVNQNFDYAICKIYSTTTIEQFKLDNKSDWIIDNIYCCYGFLNDVIEQKITYHAQNFDLIEIQHSVNTHLSRIIEKYPNYTFDYEYYDKKDNNYTANIDDFLKTIKQYYALKQKADQIDIKTSAKTLNKI